MARVTTTAASGPHASSSCKKEDEVGEGEGRRIAAGQPPPRAPPLHAAAGPRTSSSCEKEDEVGEGKGKKVPAGQPPPRVVAEEEG
jgi:hypothetical protein